MYRASSGRLLCFFSTWYRYCCRSSACWSWARAYCTYLVVSPREHNILEATVGLIYAVLSRVNGVFVIGVSGESFRVYDLIGELAAHDKGILRGRDKVRQHLSDAPDIGTDCLPRRRPIDLCSPRLNPISCTVSTRADGSTHWAPKK